MRLENEGRTKGRIRQHARQHALGAFVVRPEDEGKMRQHARVASPNFPGVQRIVALVVTSLLSALDCRHVLISDFIP